MPQYRIYLSEGRQIDLEASNHRAFFSEKSALARVDFLDDNSVVIASFTAAALHGFTRTDKLACQKDKTPNV